MPIEHLAGGRIIVAPRKHLSKMTLQQLIALDDRARAIGKRLAMKAPGPVGPAMVRTVNAIVDLQYNIRLQIGKIVRGKR